MALNNLEKNQIEEIDFWDILNTLWLNKVFIFTLISIFGLIFIIFSLFLSNIYTSKALLVPTSMGGNNEASISRNLSPVSVFGIGDSDPDVTISVAFMKSKKIVSQLMRYESFLPDLIAAEKWNTKSNSITYDKDIYNAVTKKWIREVQPPKQQVPSVQEAFKVFSKKINIIEDKQTKLISLSVNHISPSVAQQWALWVIEESNAMVANLRIEEGESSIKYLNNQIKVTPYAELRTLFYNLVQRNTQNIMLAKVNDEYALTTIDPPLIPEFKSSPRRVFIFFMGSFLGGILAVCIILLRRYRYNNKSQLVFSNWLKVSLIKLRDKISSIKYRDS